jgi:hypothetical protein
VRGPVKKFDANDFKAEQEGLEALARSKEFVQAVYVKFGKVEGHLRLLGALDLLDCRPKMSIDQKRKALQKLKEEVEEASR